MKLNGQLLHNIPHTDELTLLWRVTTYSVCEQLFQTVFSQY